MRIRMKYVRHFIKPSDPLKRIFAELPKLSPEQLDKLRAKVCPLRIR